MALVTTGKIDTAPATALEAIYATDAGSDFVVCKSPEKLKKLLMALREGASVHYVSDGDWSMHDLIIELLKKHKPADLWITTYALREFSIRQLILAQQRAELLSVNMLIDYRAKMRTPDVFHLASQNVNRIHLTSIHAKVCVLRSPGASISVVGSANWTSNPRIEAGVVSLDPAVADFHIDWIEKTMDNAEVFS